MNRTIFYLMCLLLATQSKAQIITTIAGNGTAGYSGDHGLATDAQIQAVTGIWLDKYGNFYLADLGNSNIRKIDTGGIITTIAGIGVCDTFSDGIQATNASLCAGDNATDDSGNVYTVDVVNYKIRKINVSSGIVTTFAGTGLAGYSGDNGPATLAMIRGIEGVYIDKHGNLYFSDYFYGVVRKVNSAGIIKTIAGNGVPGYSGDNGPATNAQLAFGNYLRVTVDDEGNVYIPDNNNSRIRKVDTNGKITTIAGTGVPGYNGDGIAATAAQIKSPLSVYKDKYGNIIFSDLDNYRIRKINPAGIISTIAGTGAIGYGGDGGPASIAILNGPGCIIPDSNGNIYISDVDNFRIRKISATL